MDAVSSTEVELAPLALRVERVEYARKGYHLEVELAPGGVPAVARLLRERGFYLVFVSAVHLAPSLTVVYQFAHYREPCRILLRVPLGEWGSIATISPLFQGADWHERETREMFGVEFVGHPYPEPLLLAEEDADLRPLLKREEALRTAEAVGWGEP